MANALTLLRVLCSLCMVWTPALSPRFFALYIACGLSDMLDGWVARRTGTASPLGAKLEATKIEAVALIGNQRRILKATLFGRIPDWHIVKRLELKQGKGV